ncbi:hypothetical protein ACFY7C_12075 [Streptomyces sp. NPDC012769]|uniref:hypothetical protein n=1 Tax=Streptomyces sp. NPDC012769 TaxID=3364848 RepID=UPI0036B8D103
MDAEPPEETRGSRLRGHIGWWLGAVSAGVGILAFFLTRCESDAPSFSDWKVKVNAICEQQAPQITNKIFEATAATKVFNDNPNPGQPELDAIAAKQRIVAAAFSHLVGSWRALEQPDGRKGDIEKMYSAGQDVTSTTYSMAEAIEANEHDFSHYQAQADAGKQLATEVRALDLDQCEEMLGAPEDWELDAP